MEANGKDQNSSAVATLSGHYSGLSAAYGANQCFLAASASVMLSGPDPTHRQSSGKRSDPIRECDGDNEDSSDSDSPAELSE